MLTFEKYLRCERTLFRGGLNAPREKWKTTLGEYVSDGPTTYALHHLTEMTNTLESKHTATFSMALATRDYAATARAMPLVLL